MALESVLAIAPPLVGAGNKDTQNAGEYQSEENINDESISAGEAVDLEEGEILDSGGEEQENIPHSDVQVIKNEVDALCDDFDEDGEPGNIGKKKRKKKRKKKDGEEIDADPAKQGKKRVKYVDHDHMNDDSVWFRRVTIKDYHRNHGGSPYSSPQGSSHHDYSSDHNRSESPDSSQSVDENANEYDHGPSGHRENRQRPVKRRVLRRKQNAERGSFKKKTRPPGMRLSDMKKKRRPMRLKRREPRQRATCKFYMDGKCVKGSDCPFAHNTSPPKKKDLCKFYLNGYCAKGEKCLYMHGEFPCKFFHTGRKCYSEPNCNFSHEPMSEEMERIFKRFMEKSKKEDEEMEMMFAEEMAAANSQPQQKRPSLLGSPPRHVKEAAETWQWQQQIMQMQRNKRGPRNGMQQRTPFNRPNFYVDTMSRSPVKQSNNHHEPHGNQGYDEPPFNYYDDVRLDSPPTDCRTPIPTDEDDEDNKFSGEDRKDDDLLWDEARSMSHSAESPPAETSPLHILAEPEIKSEPLSPPPQPAQLQAPLSPPPFAAPPAAIPSHLPRRQRELFLRIQQHQKEMSAASGESSEEQEEKKPEEPPVAVEPSIKEPFIKEEIEELDECEDEQEEEETKEKWYSSDEDDNEDQPLAEVLKKLQQMPLPPPVQPSQQVMSSPTTAVPQSIDISKMLNSIRQQANQQVFNMQSEFWQNILATAAPLPLPKSTEQPVRAQQMASNRDPRCRDAQMPILASPAEPSAGNRDPRSGSRDPRSLSRIQTPRPIEVKPNPVNVETNDDKVWEVRVPGRKTDGKVGSTSYRIHTVSVLPRDYSPYVHATQNDLKLLSDPRLKKLLAQCPIPSTPVLPFPPDLRPSLEKQKDVETSKLTPEPRVLPPEIGVRKLDPRLARSAALLASPPQPEVPHLPVSLLNQPSVVPFPRPIIDPRLARLHHPPDVRRLPQKRPVKDKAQTEQEKADVLSKRMDKVIFKQPIPPPKKQDTSITEKEAIGGSLNRRSILDYASPLSSYDEGSNTGSGYSSYNRRPQPRPAPTNSLTDNLTTVSGSNTTSTTCVTNVSASVQGTSQGNIPSPVSRLLPGEVASPPQDPVPGFNPCSPDADLANHASLKDVFKTIDPTASPFC